jgi:hypothetical protein
MSFTLTSNACKPDYRETLAERLRGHTVVVPDVLHTIYNNPTIRVNDTKILTQCLEPWLNAYVPTEAQREKQRRANTSLLSSYFYSRVPKDKFTILGSLFSWFFFWDDEVDCGSLTLDKEGRTDAYCDDAIAFITYCMQPELNRPKPAPGRLHNSGCFVDIGAAMQDHQTRVDRDRLLTALVAEINSARQNRRSGRSA